MSELSGKPLDGMAEVHHKDRVADKPERAFDPTNLAVIRKDEHSEYHNSDYPQNEKGYEQFEKNIKIRYMCLNFGIQNASPLLNQSLKGSKIGVVCTPLTDYQLTTIDYYTRL